MAKDAITVTIDRHLHTWIKEKGGNKSKIVNNLLHKQWIAEGKKPYNQRRRSRKLDIDSHMKQLYKEMGWEDE